MPNSPRRRGCGGRARIRGSQTDGTRPPRSCWRCSSSVVQAHASADAQWGSWRGLKACISGPSATSGVLAPLCLHFTFPSCCTCIRRTPLATHSPSPTSLAAMAAPPVCRHVAFSCNLARQPNASHRIASLAQPSRNAPSRHGKRGNLLYLPGRPRRPRRKPRTPQAGISVSLDFAPCAVCQKNVDTRKRKTDTEAAQTRQGKNKKAQ